MTKNQTWAIMKNGRLVLLDSSGGWQMWEYKDMWYSLHVSGDPSRASIWCAVKDLPRHLRDLQRITGYRYETQRDIVIVNPDLFPAY